MRWSIVVPNRNSGPTLRRALASLLSQGPGVEIVVKDCESTDESGDILAEHEARLAAILRGPDDGIYDGINRGFAGTQGEIRGWLAADDELIPGALALASRFFQTHPEIGVVTGACEMVYPDGTRRVQHPPTDPWELIARKNVIAQSSTFWRSNVHRQLGELDTSYPSAGDWDYWCRMKSAGIRVGVIPSVLSRCYCNGSNLSSRLGSGFVDEATRILSAYATHGEAYSALYRFLFKHYDLTGAMDVPPTSSFPRRAASAATWICLRALLGRQVVENYNWHFASLQERGLKWW